MQTNSNCSSLLSVITYDDYVYYYNKLLYHAIHFKGAVMPVYTMEVCYYSSDIKASGLRHLSLCHYCANICCVALEPM